MYETELTLKVIEESYKTLRAKMTVIEPPGLDIDSFRDSVIGLFNDRKPKLVRFINLEEGLNLFQVIPQPN